MYNKNNYKKILFVSYYFPPSASSGAIRPAKFIKYLPELGWKPVVLTCRDSFDFGVKDNPDLLKELPDNVDVYRTLSFELIKYYWNIKNKKNMKSNKFYTYSDTKENGNKILLIIKELLLDIISIPDRSQGWIPFAIFRGLKLVKRLKIDLIFATAPPPSALIVGYFLSMITRIPLIVEYRDPWTWAPWARKHYEIFEKLNIWIEEKLQKQSRYIIAMTEIRAKELNTAHPMINSSKYVVIPNGYNSENIQEDLNSTYKKLTFIHAGSLYSNDGLDDFLEVISDIIENNLEFKENINVLFAGAKPECPEFSRLERQGVANFLGRIPVNECLNIISRSHIGLVFLRNIRFNIGCIASKVYDYMGVKKNILAVVPDGSTKDFINTTGVGVAIGLKDKENLKKAILSFYSDYREGSLNFAPSLSENEIIKYSWKEITRETASLFNLSITN